MQQEWKEITQWPGWHGQTHQMCLIMSPLHGVYRNPKILDQMKPLPTLIDSHLERATHSQLMCSVMVQHH